MTKAELIERVHKDAGDKMSKKQVAETVESTFDKNRTVQAFARLQKLAVIVAALAACATPSGVGANCKEDRDCRRGNDCFKGRCTQVCSPAEPCPEGFECSGYRCLPRAMSTRSKARQLGAPSDGPDPVASELRAIRVELETIRRQQTELLERLEPP